jgi:hypothetical protein
MTRLRFTILFVLAAAACGDELPDGPGRPAYPQEQLCQWKTPCPQAEPLPDGGASDGAPLSR